ncbi:unnamed protein product [Rangifer tarandus platyrhynchus]|uniref:Uncharacterized protein n=1 Tax=Rangifer tarandus platyrhynchus TaxID=3082113 RepID=A0AC59ZBF3_RANTA
MSRPTRGSEAARSAPAVSSLAQDQSRLWLVFTEIWQTLCTPLGLQEQPGCSRLFFHQGAGRGAAPEGRSGLKHQKIPLANP